MKKKCPCSLEKKPHYHNVKVNRRSSGAYKYYKMQINKVNMFLCNAVFFYGNDSIRTENLLRISKLIEMMSLRVRDLLYI